MDQEEIPEILVSERQHRQYNLPEIPKLLLLA